MILHNVLQIIKITEKAAFTKKILKYFFFALIFSEFNCKGGGWNNNMLSGKCRLS